jgi:hypothetical protein
MDVEEEPPQTSPMTMSRPSGSENGAMLCVHFSFELTASNTAAGDTLSSMIAANGSAEKRRYSCVPIHTIM